MEELYIQIYRYIEHYARNYRSSFIDAPGVAYYAGVLLHILSENKQLPTEQRSLEQCINHVFNHKRVLEIGCRSGSFLAFLRAHGAIVAGSTGEKYFKEAKNSLGENATIALAESHEVGSIREIRQFNPDFLISYNLFDRGRWSGKTPPYRKLYASLLRIVGPRTRVFMAPAVDTVPIFDPKKLKQIKRIRAFNEQQVVISPIKRESIPSEPLALTRFYSLRFRVQPKRKRR